MPRQSRIDAPGALHHVIVRGIARRKIYYDDQDRDQFVDRLGSVLEDTDTACFAWALIPNHFHLFLKTGLVPLSTVMRRLLTGYAMNFNRRHRRAGHLFQNRYKSILCQEDNYLLELTRYIHLNPLRAKLVKTMRELGRYPYAGHSVIMDRCDNDWQDVGYILRLFGSQRREARRKYRKFVEKGVKQGRRPELTGGGLVRSSGGWTALKTLRAAKEHIKGDERILGDSEFVQRCLQQANERLEQKYKIQSRGYDLDKIAHRVGHVMQMPVAQILAAGKYRRRVQARSLLCYWAVRKWGLTIVSVSNRLGISQSAVSQSIKRGETIALENDYRLGLF